eukprot:COSAG06_NODE_6101_length_3109_cov_1.789701_1_plen_29_part_10
MTGDNVKAKIQDKESIPVECAPEFILLIG